MAHESLLLFSGSEETIQMWLDRAAVTLLRSWVFPGILHIAWVFTTLYMPTTFSQDAMIAQAPRLQ